MYIRDEFKSDIRYFSSALILAAGIVAIVVWTPVSVAGALALGGLLILAAFLVFRTRVYIKIDEDKRTYECICGILGLSPLYKGGFEEISHIEIHRLNEIGRYTSTEFFPVYVQFRDPINKKFLLQKSRQFEEASTFAHKLSKVTALPLKESRELQQVRNTYKQAAYEQPEE